MLLSVIIVSYEVKYFLEQCLFSVKAAVDRLEKDYGKHLIEIIVIDNASKDGTVAYLESRFPTVLFIGYQKNLGFAQANNLGIMRAQGSHILFLNPDTIIAENTLSDCVSFFQSHPSAGAIGLRMIDGSGRFLPESKRGFPTAWRSFCKLSGLSNLFPSSRMFAGYNLGHIDQSAVLPIDAIAGAFMMVRKDVLNKTGLFDERFFMYAEDIDLSKRIKDAGFENYYLGNKVIVHFKGESTKKDRAYVGRFYQAMHQYVEKHYTGFGSRIFVFLMKLGINLRSMFARAGVRRADTGQDRISSARFFGDKNVVEGIKRRLVGIADNPNSDTTIFCEGEQYGFASMIEDIQKLPAARRAMVHAAGSNSIVGSFDRDKQGTVIPLISS